MQKFRIYALIHGQTIPLGDIGGCNIRHMDFEEQKERKFSPIQSEFSENDGGYKTYATNLPFVDPLKLHTNHAVIFEIEERDSRAALGGAIRAFDKLCSSLFITGIFDANSMHNRPIGETYLYQVNKIYVLDNKGAEQEASLDLKSGHIYLPNRPDRNTWLVPASDKFLSELFKFNDPVFKKALKYLYSSSVGHYKLNSYEKIALDHFKSIELIINTLINKDKEKDFKRRVDQASEILGLTADESTQIKKYWDARSNGDIAHSDHNDSTAWYPNQFPLPTGLEYPWSYLDNVARVVLLKYLDIRKRHFHVDLYTSHDSEDHLSLGVINEQSECNHLFFYTQSKDKKQILKQLSEAFVNSFGLNKEDVEVEFIGSKEKARIFVKEAGKKIELQKLRKRMIRIF